MVKLTIKGGKKILDAVKVLSKWSTPKVIKQASKFVFAENQATFSAGKAPNGRKLKLKKDKTVPIRFARLGNSTWKTGFKITASPRIAYYHQVGARIVRGKNKGFFRRLLGLRAKPNIKSVLPTKTKRLPKRSIIPFKSLPKKWLHGVTNLFRAAIGARPK